MFALVCEGGLLSCVCVWVGCACGCCDGCSEKDLDEVLQTDNVFTNVSKGQLARQQELSFVFDDMSHEQVLKEVRSKGALLHSTAHMHHHLRVGGVGHGVMQKTGWRLYMYIHI